MLNCLIAGAGGFLGSAARYLLGLLPLGKSSGFPITTLAINVIGAFAIGLITALAAKNAALDSRLVLFLKIGVCGGFTTFSTFALDSVTLLQNGMITEAVIYCALSFILCIGAVFIAQIAAA